MSQFILSLIVLSSTLWAQSPLDDLLLKVKKEQEEQTALAQKRENEFLQNKDQQKSMLAKAKAELALLEVKTKALSKVFETQEKDLAEVENKLTIATGTLGEMFGIVKQMSGDLQAQFENSITSAQFKGREKFIGDLAQRKELPTIEELKRLWMEILTEINESGKVVPFKAEVTEVNGKSFSKTVWRIGSFNLISDGKYLSYQSDSGKIIELSRQPESRHLSLIEDFESEKELYLPLSLDPSRGSLLSMLVNAPDFLERVDQGGLVGYAILVLLAVGIFIVIERSITLTKMKKKFIRQLETNEIDETNALGRLKKVFIQFKESDIETLELKLEESIIKSLPEFDRGIGTLKILVAIAPLMGLLGTVTGMIETFQSITLFGTGDPKLMAGGISTALVTTVQGLVTAIPMLLLHNYVSGKSKDLTQILEEQSTGMLSIKAGK
jgi:biopolymer transport protein ExbB